MLLISIILILVLKSFHKGDNRILVLFALFWGLLILINNFFIGFVPLFNGMFTYNYKYALGSILILIISIILITRSDFSLIFGLINSFSIVMFHFSVNWFTIILCLEIFTYSVLGIYFSKFRINESLFYFFVSGFATGLLIIGVITNRIMFIILGLLIKAGAAPLHYYAPKLYLKDVDSSILYLYTLSKSVLILLIPFLNTTVCYLIAISNLLIGIWNAIIRTSNLFGMLVFSSISHIGYFLLSGNSDVGLFYIYQSIIVAGITSLCLIEMGKVDLKEATLNIHLKVTLILILFSNLGLPPLLGFYGKLFVLESVNQPWIWFLVVGSSTLSGLYYLDSIRRIILNDNMGSVSNHICRHYLFWIVLLSPFWWI